VSRRNGLASNQIFSDICVSREFKDSLDIRTFGQLRNCRMHSSIPGHACCGRIPLLVPSAQRNLSRSQAAAVREAFPECRVKDFDILTHRRNKSYFHRLPVACKPVRKSDGSCLWPTHPTLFERLEMIRSGYTGPDDRPFGDFLRVGMKEFNGNHRLASAVIRRFVIGLRSDMRVPEKFSGYFRYCQGFLILTAACIPIGLARFLAGVWCTDPYSLWLDGKGTLKQCLRVLPSSFKKWLDCDNSSEFSFEEDSDG